MSALHDVEVFFVEDNPRDAELTLRVMRTHNLANRIVHVKDGQEALDWLFGEGAWAGWDVTRHPRFMLLDLKLPKVSGLEVLRAVRTDERTRSMPVVVFTSSNEERDLIESYKLGINSYVVKPVDFESFSAAVAATGHYWLIVNRTER